MLCPLVGCDNASAVDRSSWTWGRTDALLADREWAKGVIVPLSRALIAVALAIARRADLVVVADEHVPPQTARHRLVVRNLPDGDYLPAPGEPDADPRAVYIGDLRRSRGLQSMIARVSAAPGWRLDLVGPVSEADQPWVDDWLTRSKEAGRVRLYGRLPPREAWRIADGAWVESRARGHTGFPCGDAIEGVRVPQLWPGGARLAPAADGRSRRRDWRRTGRG